jgi:hypothetical protein
MAFYLPHSALFDTGPWESGYVEPGILTNLPYEDNSFDIVMSSDVLEHIHVEEADQVVSELVRVSRRHLFLSISLKVGRCRLTASKPELKASLVSALETKMWWTAFKLCFQFQRAPLHQGPHQVHRQQRRRGGAVQVDSIKTRVESAPGFSSW